MADFHQTGVISTLHRLGKTDLRRLEADLLEFSDDRPVALVLPCLYSELHGPALKGAPTSVTTAAARGKRSVVAPWVSTWSAVR